jgi:hypothetical protein
MVKAKKLEKHQLLCFSVENKILFKISKIPLLSV